MKVATIHTSAFLFLVSVAMPLMTLAQENTKPHEATVTTERITPIGENDILTYTDNTQLKLTRNEVGQHVYISSRGARVFDPKTLTLSVPMDDPGYILKVSTEKTDAGWKKTYYTRSVIGAKCPVDLFWRITYVLSNETARVSIDGKESTFDVKQSVQEGTWACGQHGGGDVKMTVVYSPELDLVIAMDMAMEWNGVIKSGNAKLLEIRRPPPTEVKTAKN